MKNKIISVVLLGILLSSMISCTKNSEPAESVGSASTAITTEKQEEITADYNGYGFLFYCRNCCDHADNIWPDYESSDIVDVAAWNRNEYVRERVNAVICEPIVETDGYPNSLVAHLQAGDNVCDAILWHRYYLCTLALEGYLSNLANYEGFRFEKEHWATDIIENYSFGGVTYFADGYYTTDILSDTGCLVFNEKIYGDKFRDDGSLYDKVNKGEWTIDTLNYYVKKGGQDLDGDGMFIPGDIFGMILSRQHLFQFQGCAGQLSVDKDANGNLEYVLYTDKMVSIVEKIYDMTVGLASTYMIESAEQARDMFANGNCLFATTALRDLTWETMRNMKDGYGVLPYPKYDESQTGYKSRLFAHSSLLGLPYNIEDGERSAVILDVMAEIGYRDVAPVFYETALKNKYTSEESWAMLDLIMEGVTSDFGDIIKSCPVYALDHVVGVLKTRDFTSWYEEGKDSVIADLDDTVARFRKYADR